MALNELALVTEDDRLTIVRWEGEMPRACESLAEKLSELVFDHQEIDAEFIAYAHRAVDDGAISPYSVTSADDVARWLGQRIGNGVSCEPL